MDLMNVMHEPFSAFDTCMESLDLFTMDTFDDAYMVAGWLSRPSSGMLSRTSSSHSLSDTLTAQQQQTQKLC
jgi:hypothetical protein